MNKFNNKNAETFVRWLIRRDDNLDQVVFYFLSKLNATSARYFPLFNSNNRIRIVYLNGLNLPKTDFFMLLLYKIFLIIFNFKFKKYTVFHNISAPIVTKSKYQILHIDDPEYSASERRKIIKWLAKVAHRDCIPIIICTNEFTQKWLTQFSNNAYILIIEQGFVEAQAQNFEIKKLTNFTCVYSSPYIHFGSDKLSGHSTWGADLLLSQIIPRINESDVNIHIILIGELGKDAKKRVLELKNVVSKGRVNFKENAAIISACHVALYPRDLDLNRSMTKIFTYIGAGVPTVTFDLNDTRIIKDKQLGFSVSSVADFVDKIVFLKQNPDILNEFSKRVELFKDNYSWLNLTNKMNESIKLFIKDSGPN
jgi:glycosyltransferase involved in cell wall biosynthesis